MDNFDFDTHIKFIQRLKHDTLQKFQEIETFFSTVKIKLVKNEQLMQKYKCDIRCQDQKNDELHQVLQTKQEEYNILLQQCKIIDANYDQLHNQKVIMSTSIPQTRCENNGSYNDMIQTEGIYLNSLDINDRSHGDEYISISDNQSRNDTVNNTMQNHGIDGNDIVNNMDDQVNQKKLQKKDNIFLGLNHQNNNNYNSNSNSNSNCNTNNMNCIPPAQSTKHSWSLNSGYNDQDRDSLRSSGNSLHLQNNANYSNNSVSKQNCSSGKRNFISAQSITYEKSDRSEPISSINISHSRGFRNDSNMGTLEAEYKENLGVNDILNIDSDQVDVPNVSSYNELNNNNANNDHGSETVQRNDNHGTFCGGQLRIKNGINYISCDTENRINSNSSRSDDINNSRQSNVKQSAFKSSLLPTMVFTTDKDNDNNISNLRKRSCGSSNASNSHSLKSLQILNYKKTDDVSNFSNNKGCDTNKVIINSLPTMFDDDSNSNFSSDSQLSNDNGNCGNENCRVVRTMNPNVVEPLIGDSGKNGSESEPPPAKRRALNKYRTKGTNRLRVGVSVSKIRNDNNLLDQQNIVNSENIDDISNLLNNDGYIENVNQYTANEDYHMNESIPWHDRNMDIVQDEQKDKAELETFNQEFLNINSTLNRDSVNANLYALDSELNVNNINDNTEVDSDNENRNHGTGTYCGGKMCSKSYVHN